MIEFVLMWQHSLFVINESWIITKMQFAFQTQSFEAFLYRIQSQLHLSNLQEQLYVWLVGQADSSLHVSHFEAFQWDDEVPSVTLKTAAAASWWCCVLMCLGDPSAAIAGIDGIAGITGVGGVDGVGAHDVLRGLSAMRVLGRFIASVLQLQCGVASPPCYLATLLPCCRATVLPCYLAMRRRHSACRSARHSAAADDPHYVYVPTV